MAVTTDMIAVALGVAAPEPGSPQALQWQMWVEDASMLIEARRIEVNDALVLDQTKLDYVVRQAVVAHVQQPDNATQVLSVTSDDTNVSRTYRSGLGRVQITDDWWALLGLSPRSSGAFSFTPTYCYSAHLPWCALMFAAAYCSCGVDIAGYPIFEQG